MRSSAPLDTRARLADPGRKRELNVDLFRVVAPRYDAVTRVLSFGRDRRWKARMVESLPPVKAPRCLDLACGTGDLSFLLAARYPDGQIVGLDLTEAIKTERYEDAARARDEILQAKQALTPSSKSAR